MRLAQFKIATRLAASFGAILVLFVILGVVVARESGTVRAAFARVVTDQVPKVAAANQVLDIVNEQALLLRDMALFNDSARIQASRQKLTQTTDRISTILDDMAPRLTSAGTKAALAGVLEARKGFVSARDGFLSLLDAGELDAARESLLSQVQPAHHAYLRAVDKLIEVQTARMTVVSQEADAAIQQMVTLTVALIAFALAASAVLGWLITRSITRPVRQAVDLSRAVAQGDLSVHIEAHGRDELAELLASLRQMQAGLVDIVAQVRTGAEGVATASQQIAMGNADLSQRTEEQASSLQQTAASMEQLTGTVEQNAQHARDANGLTRQASSSAVEGGRTVGQVVETMREIQESSRRIADIIGVIDGIAFQTNILALNAAVEAARAGEQGRGFAVVAGEVRALAQRSAEAAKEIKSLITASTERVDAGSRLVDAAGEQMQQIVTAIQAVDDIVGQIASASREQSAGIGQVNTALVQMDTVTQQNAALVEESAAAAESLKAQADAMVRAVGVFRLGNESGLRPVTAPVAVPAPHVAAPRKPAAVKAPQPAPASGTRPVTKPAAQPEPQAPSPRAARTAPAAEPSVAEEDWTTF